MIRFACFLIVVFSTLPAMRAEEEWVTVGSPGNRADANRADANRADTNRADTNRADATGLGAVAYEFQIMKYEVTVRQYAAFLNCVAVQSDPHQLWLPAMGEHVVTDLGQGGIRKDVPQCILREGAPGAWSYRPVMDREDGPVFCVSFFSALRYANWLQNGGRNGDTESGAYDLSQGAKVTRSASATIWLPNEDEWYKAAYYQPENCGGPTGGYWRFPFASNDIPVSSEPGSEEKLAACFSRKFSGMVTVGSYPNAKSPCGALDMGGNVWEWTETVVFDWKRAMRGGSAAHRLEKMRSDVRSNASPDRWYPDTGFRLARRMGD
jgi:formylglycine-generating enzyme required for sulfatase activity